MATTRLPIRRPEAPRRHFRLDRVPDPAEAPKIGARLRAAWGFSSDERLDLDRVCARLGAEASATHMNVPRGGAQGFLIPRANGFVIEVDPEPGGGWEGVPAPLRYQLERHRRRFLVAHEVAHTLFYAMDEEKPRRVLPDSDRQERFCDELARTLLVPAAAAASLPFRPESAIELQGRFDVSIEVALRSLTAAHAGAGSAWLLLRKQNQTKIQWTSASPRLIVAALRSVRALASRAYLSHRAEASLATGHGAAIYLPQREQVIVTAGR